MPKSVDWVDGGSSWMEIQCQRQGCQINCVPRIRLQVTVTVISLVDCPIHDSNHFSSFGCFSTVDAGGLAQGGASDAVQIVGPRCGHGGQGRWW